MAWQACIFLTIGLIVGSLLVGKALLKIIDMLMDEKEMTYSMYSALLRHLKSDRDLTSLTNEYEMIAVYGAGELGKLLLCELEKSNAKSLCVIDKNAESLSLPIPCYKPDDVLPEIDLVIVTIDRLYGEIASQLEEIVHGEIVLWEDIIKQR